MDHDQQGEEPIGSYWRNRLYTSHLLFSEEETFRDGRDRMCLPGHINLGARKLLSVTDSSITLASLSLRPTQLLAQITNSFCSLSNCDIHISTTPPFLAQQPEQYPAYAGKLTITHDSDSDQNGGAIAVILDGSNNEECRLTVDLETCHFSNTTARTGEGGAIFFNVQGDSECSGSIVIRAKTEFSDCISNVGGCIRSSISSSQPISFMLDDSFVESSTAETGGGITHEVLLSSTSSFSVNECRIRNCSSNCGGSFMFIIHEYLAISIAHTTFNASTSSQEGGCIAIKQYKSTTNHPFSLILSHLFIHHCSSKYMGGCVFVEQVGVDIEGESVITCDQIDATHCSSSSYGGFFYLNQTGSMNLSMSTSLIQSLFANSWGAFLYCIASKHRDLPISLTITISNVNFTDLSCAQGSLLHWPNTSCPLSIFLTLEYVSVKKLDCVFPGSLIRLDPCSVPVERECVLKNCYIA
ncbi:hypothetical protein BLNAU_13517 [Blattamonas nauphoetae]|uniref:Uncharacterized protein n=1 Tax=Blattamonas nauphoetae TaxID=2049346 RepID=A0ABQ9XJW1_9EUKA|nr:hypothetical protein BLNAU_13517 [Blattamonas nauphoetae]